MLSPAVTQFLKALDPASRDKILAIKNPFQVQALLDEMPYVGEDRNRSPLQVMQDRQCHCLDGGLLGALVLNLIGFPPRIIDLVPQPDVDDDHVLAIFQIDGFYGAVAKSNFSGLRFREPVYRTLRELAMSYFEVFFNIQGEKTLRAYTRPLNLMAFDRFNWPIDEQGVHLITQRLYSLKPIPLINPLQAARLSKLDERSYQTNMMGVNLEGLFKAPAH